MLKTEYLLPMVAVYPYGKPAAFLIFINYQFIIKQEKDSPPLLWAMGTEYKKF